MKLSDKFQKLVPPGYPLENLMRSWGWTMTVMVSLSFIYIPTLLDLVNNLLYTIVMRDGKPVRLLRQGAVMMSFPRVLMQCPLQHPFALFPVVLLALLVGIVSCRNWYRKGSKSVYLVRRLPDRWYYLRSCVLLPLLLLGITAAVVLVLMGLYLLLYLAVVPAQCLPDHAIF